MSIFEYNGSALVAMVGKNCFAIASDRRLGVQLQTIATDFKRISKIHDRLFLGLSGLATDAQTLYQRFVFRHKLYQLREERDMKPETFANLVSAILYEKRFGPYLCQPVIAGLGDEDKPFICTMDSIGAKELAKDFVVAGTASESLYGACESMFKENMEPEELFETISQALLSSVDRDCLSGWGGHVYVVFDYGQCNQLIFLRLHRRRWQTFWLSARLSCWKILQFSLWINMGFYLLHREFLRCQSTEVDHGIGSVLHCCSFNDVQFSYSFICYIKWVSASALVIVSAEWYGEALHAGSHFVNFVALSCAISFERLRGPMDVSSKSLSGRWRDYRGVHLRKSLRPRSHRIKVGISRDALYKRKPTKHGNHVNTVHDIRVTHTSKFAQKSANYRGRVHRSRRSL
ncbi:hypothetical protein CRYUN_Cryun30bG0073500 [Craigia yunnanensis]